MYQVSYDLIANKGSQIIVRKFSGEIHVEDILQSFRYIHEHLLNDQIIGIVTDFNDCIMSLSMLDLQQVIQYIKKTSEYHGIKLAVVVDTPDKIVFPLMAQAKTQEAIIKPFSTIDSALNWIFN